MNSALERIYGNWVYGAFLTGILLIVLSPLITKGWTYENLIVWLCLPAYMVHQYEEHENDRFRLYFNLTIAGRKDALSQKNVFVINVLVVWLVLTLSLYLVFEVGPGWGCVVIALLLVNAIIHIVSLLKQRSYNPGLYTAIILFLPLSITWLVISSNYSTFQIFIAFFNAVLIHGSILAFVHYKLKSLRT